MNIETGKDYIMLNLSKEQMDVLYNAIKENIEKQKEKSIIEFDKTLDVVVDKLAVEGWTLPAELGIYAVNTIGNTDDINDVDGFLKMYFSQDDYLFTKNIIVGILASKIKNGLKKMTAECWTAFQNKLYAVCATSLLSVIEGILSEFSDNKQDVKMMKVCQKQLDTYPANGGTIAKHIWISYNKFIRNLYLNSDFTTEEPESINRHWLLHGRSDFEIDELDCIRLFNAIQSLCMIVNKRSEDDIVE